MCSENVCDSTLVGVFYIPLHTPPCPSLEGDATTTAPHDRQEQRPFQSVYKNDEVFFLSLRVEGRQGVRGCLLSKVFKCLVLWVLSRGALLKGLEFSVGLRFGAQKFHKLYYEEQEGQ